MTSRIPFYLSILLLIAVGILLSVFRHQQYGVPYLPGDTRQVWDVEARIEFTALDQPVKISLAIPDTQHGFTRTSRSSSSPGYGVSYIKSESGGQ